MACLHRIGCIDKVLRMIYGERSKSIPRIYLRWVWASYTSYLRQAVCANGGLTFLRDLLSGIYASVVAWAVGSLAWRYAPLLLRRPSDTCGRTGLVIPTRREF